MNYEDILKIILDNLRYPEFVKAFENLNQFEQKELCQEFENVFNAVYKDGYEDCESEEHAVYDDGYENGMNDGLNTASEIIVKYVEDFELRDKLLEELEKNES